MLLVRTVSVVVGHNISSKLQGSHVVQIMCNTRPHALLVRELLKLGKAVSQEV